MGKLVSSTIPSLISGVSQQPWNVRLVTQAEEQVNCYSSVVDFMKRRPATRHVAKLLEAAEGVSGDAVVMHHINRDQNEQYIVLAGHRKLFVFDMEGRRKTVTLSHSGSEYLDFDTASCAPFKFLTINDYTFILNTTKTVAMDTATTPIQPNEAFVFIKQASYNTTYTITIDATAFSFTTADGVAPADQPADNLSSEEIAQNLAGQINATEGWKADTAQSTLWIRRTDGGPILLKASDSRSNTHITSYTGKVQSFSDLPRYALNNSVVEITGDGSNSFDNYYVQFVTDSAGETLGKGVWKETIKPGTQYRLNAATLPHALVRQADGSFTFDAVQWGERSCGDEDSAPDPSFVGRTISGLFFYRNRLSFLSWENVIMSRAGEFFSFFPTTVTTMIDNDPVDVAASHTRPTALEHAVIFSGGLLLFTADTQLTLEHDTILSNATVSIKPVTEFASSMKAEPASSGKTVFFTVDRGSYSGIREYLTLPDNTDQNDAADITAHVPRYIGGNVHRLICSTNEDVLFVLSRNNRREIGVYKYFWNGAEKIQSSWSRWLMAGDVLSGFMRETSLYLLMSYADGLYLEELCFEPGFKDAGSAFEYRLDRKITEKDVTITYNSTTKLSTITMPYTITITGVPICVSSTSPAGYEFTTQTRTSDNSFIVKGDARNMGLFIGLPFESSYTFSTFAIREQSQNGGGGNAVMSGRLQLRSLSLSCADTGFLTVEVTPKFRDTSTHHFTARELGHGSNLIGAASLYTGLVKIPVLSLNTQVSVGVKSSSFYPFALVNATWEGFYNSRSQRT